MARSSRIMLNASNAHVLIHQDIVGICHSLAYQIAQQCDHSNELMFGLTKQEAEVVQTDAVVAVEKLVVRQLHGLAASGKRIVLLVDALDEAQERGTNRVVRLLRDLGKAKTNALSLITTMRPEPAANMQILKAAFGIDNVMQVATSDLFKPSESQNFSTTGTSASPKDCLAVAPEWAAAVEDQSNELSKIFVALCRGFVNAWWAHRRPASALPTPPKTTDGAYRQVLQP